MLPTFIGVGAAKTGTTMLHAHLEAHPQVCLSLFKEPDFFHNEIGVLDGGYPGGPPASGHYWRGLTWYEGLFRACEGARAIGEISTAYIAVIDAPELIHQVVPLVKLIFSLRDPVARMYSHYWEERKAGWPLPDFETMVTTHHPRFEYYRWVSSYHLHLERYLSVFPGEQVGVFLFDDLSANPQVYLREVYRFIGVDEDFSAPNLGRRYNESSIARYPWLQRSLIRMASVRWELSSHWWIYEWLAKAGRLLVKLNSAVGSYPSLPVELRMGLIKEFEETIEYVETYLQRDLPRWKMSE